MFNIISARWQTLKTKYKKIIPFILTFIFCFSPLSVSAADFSADGSHEWYLLPFSYFLDGSVEGTFDEVTHTFNAVSSSAFNNDTYIAYQVSYNIGSSFPTLVQGHNYLLYYNISFPLSETFSVLDFGFENTVYFGKTKLFETSGVDYGISSTSGIFSFSPSNSFAMNTSSSIDFNLSVPFTSVGRCIWAFYLLDVTDNTESEVNQIVSAINNQTDFIINGNSSTGGIVSGADSSKSELESIVSDYQQIENSMLDNFTLYQTDILTDLNGWSWGGLSLCANWVGDTMTSYFQNMGDFKQYIIYPLLLGIALFFIGRGSSIIGHLFRKPTETYTFSERSSSTKYVNGQRITTSVTKFNRDGGVLRK